jgi:hypothetical protein
MALVTIGTYCLVRMLSRSDPVSWGSARQATPAAPSVLRSLHQLDIDGVMAAYVVQRNSITHSLVFA